MIKDLSSVQVPSSDPSPHLAQDNLSRAATGFERVTESHPGDGPNTNNPMPPRPRAAPGILRGNGSRASRNFRPNESTSRPSLLSQDSRQSLQNIDDALSTLATLKLNVEALKPQLSFQDRLNDALQKAGIPDLDLAPHPRDDAAFSAYAARHLTENTRLGDGNYGTVWALSDRPSALAERFPSAWRPLRRFQSWLRGPPLPSTYVLKGERLPSHNNEAAAHRMQMMARQLVAARAYESVAYRRMGRRWGGAVEPPQAYANCAMLYMKLRRAPGETLRDFTKKHPQPSTAVFIAVAKAVRDLHRTGFAHLDLKQNNIHVEPGRKPRAFLVDFGCSWPADEALPYTPGTLGRIAPEWFSKSKVTRQVVDHTKADIFSLGTIFYEMIAGQPPLSHASNEAANKLELNDFFSNRRNRKHPSCHADSPVPEIVMKMLEEDPTHRPSLDEVISLLPGQLENKRRLSAVRAAHAADAPEVH